VPELQNLVTPEEAALVRGAASSGGLVAEELRAPRIFGPIGYAVATGRAHCRRCGETIAKGEEAVSFGFDALATDGGGPASWGRLATAYLHRDPAACGEGDASG
jgi:hypothetical protein